MGKFVDMTGWVMKEHGVPDSRLTVIERTEDYISPKGYKKSQWICECSCEERNQIIVMSSDLTGKHCTKSCGCLNKERIKDLGKQSKKENNYIFDGEVVVGFTSNTNKKFYIDFKNFIKIKHICWREETQDGFSMLKGYDPQTKKRVRMHAFLGFINYDHIDRNELNNLESNLRPATQQQNTQNKSIQKNNTSGIVGVSWSKKNQKWIAYIGFNNAHKYLGSFYNKEDAIVARLCAEQKYFKEFAPQQHLFEEYGIKTKNKNNHNNKEGDI